MVQFTFADTPENFKQKDTASLRLANVDATRVRDAFGSKAFHVVVCDLPYGVQHASHGGSLEGLLESVLPAWRDVLMPGGTVAVSFNAQTLKPEKVRELMEQAKARHYENAQLDILSMGMSGSYEAAILEGATLVRVGTAIYGERYYPNRI
jgi:tRNA G10  N-methylase Trm11